MLKQGFNRVIKPIEVLNDEQIASLHSGTLHVLETTGVKFEHQKALDLFERSGCFVDRNDKRVKFPPGIVEACLRSCPSSFTVSARDPDNSLCFGGNSLYFYNSVGMRTIDLDTWEPKTPSLTDQHDGVLVLDALANLHLINTYTPYMEIEGVPPCMLLLESLASRIRHTTKVICAGSAQGSERFATMMAQAAGIQLAGWMMASPPLAYFDDACSAAFSYAEAGFPIFITSGGSYGSTAPATIAGATITNNAELIAGIVLIQLIKPGIGLVVADFTFPTDMRTGIPVFGSTNSILHASMFAQIWRSYRIPTCVSTSGYSNAKKMDFQSGYEKALAGYSAALSGANVVSLHGGISSELTFHPVQAILDNDIAGMIGRLIEGVEITQDTMAIDLIDQVGPLPGIYLNKRHTREAWKKEKHSPPVSDRLSYTEWMGQGKKSTLDYASEKLEAILAAHKPIPLADDKDQEITNVLQEARIHYHELGLM
ncbi:MAG TPA: trimethylamine methyltransferase family protein [Anaerolineales bacterium]